MLKKEIELSTEFRKQATKAILALSFFIVTYLVILLAAIALTGFCIAAGLSLIAFHPMFLTIIFGIGLASFGVLILIFLLKFMFKSHKTDLSHLIEIKERQEPELFKMINEIVQEVGTSSPKKVYLSPEVNASVFYDSSFWSMFFPVKKNLQIGLGLVNSVTKDELKAILSHEFGHFSQKTMKVGSYVYNANQIVYNLLFDNESYEDIIVTWSNVSSYFTVFVASAVKVNRGIQWILKELYGIVNKNYMGLSREMEFHADEIAASVTGYEPLKTSLLRLPFAATAFDNVLNFYDGKIAENVKSENIYNDQLDVMHVLAEINNLTLSVNLPVITMEEQHKFNKSKLIIQNQWASHPTTDERIKRMEKTGFSAAETIDDIANKLFSDIEKLQKQLTEKTFKNVKYKGEIHNFSSTEFLEEFKKTIRINSFPKLFNGYYDDKNIVFFDLSSVQPIQEVVPYQKLFSEEKIELVYSAIGLQNDIQILQNIDNNTFPVKTFDYDGAKFKQHDAAQLVNRLKRELEKLNELIKENDVAIYRYFKWAENKQQKTENLDQLYRELFEFDRDYDAKYTIYTDLINALQFTNVSTPVEQIKANFQKIQPLENSLKTELNSLLADKEMETETTQEVKDNLALYTAQTLNYFKETSYVDENLTIFIGAIHQFAHLLSRKYFLMKKKILLYQEELEMDQV